jgi:T5SS/PEP-CTERM-associated repeat protein
MSDNCLLPVARFVSNQRRRFLFVVHGACAAAAILLLVGRPAFAALSFSGDVKLGTAEKPTPATIGSIAIGSLQLDNGSSFSSGTTVFGGSPSGIGTGTVKGPRTYWSMTAADMGVSGIGELEILNGGIVETTGPLRIGVNSGAHGSILVEGDHSTLQTRGPLTVGSLSGGFGQLEINAGAIVNVTTVPTTVTRWGRLIMGGGLLRTGSLTNEGLISGSGELNLIGNATFNLNGRLEASDGDYLLISGPGSLRQNVGVISIDGGDIEFLSSLMNGRQGTQSGGEVELRNGTMRLTSTSFSDFQFTNVGSLLAIGGENHFHGRIVNGFTGTTTGPRIAITNESVMIFHDDVVLQGGTMTVFPGSKATLLEDLTVQSGAILQADIAGSDVETDYGEIEVVGNVQLGGGLRPFLAAGYVPQAGDSFPILKAFGGIEGTLTLDGAAMLPNQLMWDVEVTDNAVRLNVVQAPDGDYNRDGAVDTADFIVWRRMLGQTGNRLAADGNGDGTVDQSDHSFWRIRFGNSIHSGSAAIGAAASVPEPTGAVLLLLAAISLNRKRKPST